MYEQNDGLETLRSSVERATRLVGDLAKAYGEGEWDVDSLPQRPPRPVEMRAEAYKAEIREAQALSGRLEKKDSDIRYYSIAVEKATSVKGQHLGLA